MTYRLIINIRNTPFYLYFIKHAHNGVKCQIIGLSGQA